MENTQYIIGIDEAGRGSLAGPVYVGMVVAKDGFDFGKFSALDDSKKLSNSTRNEVKEELDDCSSSMIWAKAFYSKANTIDEIGINAAVQRAIDRGLRQLAPIVKQCHILLDGSLRAPSKYSQETVIRGDEKIPIISAASVVAKVLRDKHMNRLSNQWPMYSFEKNKGYGTERHIELLKEHGVSPEHRSSYVGNIVTI